MVIRIKEAMMGVYCDIDLHNHVCILSGDSGIGKSFLIDILKSYVERKGIKYSYLDGSTRTKTSNEIVSFCQSSDLVLLDNADLYLTSEITAALGKTVKMIVVCLHDPTLAIACEDTAFYDVEYDEDNFKVARMER